MAVRTPTTQESRAQSEAIAAAVPRNLHVASFKASLEFWRVRAATLDRSKVPLAVLSLANGSPQYDEAIIRYLSARRPNLKYTIVEGSSAHAQLKSNRATKPFTEVSESKSFADFAAANASRKFDIVHVALWRNQDWADHMGTLKAAAGMVKSTGTLIVFRFGDDGVFKLRERFADRLGPAPPGAATFTDEAVREMMEAQLFATRTELMRSLVNVSTLVTFKPSPVVLRSMGDIMQCNFETAYKSDATLLSEVSSALLDTSVASHPERCVVYTPLHVLVGTRGPTAPFHPVSAAEALMQEKVDPCFPHGAKGGFFNIGLSNWHNVRKAWKNYGSDAERMPKPPLIGVEEAISGLSRLRRTYTLPAPLALSDILDIFIDIWDDEDMR